MFSKLKLIAIFLIVFSLMTSLVIADTAVYNSTYGAPYCSSSASSCNAPSSLLEYAGGYNEGEPNQPNTIDSCADYGSNTASGNPYISSITVSSSDAETIVAGGDIDVDYTSDLLQAAVAYTSNVTNPSWTIISTTTAFTANKVNDFTLDNVVGYHAVRVYQDGFDFSNLSNTCYTSTFSETDDIVFYVAEATTPTDTCTYGGTGNWSIDLSDDCTINTDYDLGSNEITLTGTGDVTFNSSINVTNFPEPATNQNIYIAENANIMVS